MVAHSDNRGPIGARTPNGRRSTQRTQATGETKSLLVFQWNVNSIMQHIAELKAFLASTAQKPHIICLQETLIKSSKTLSIPGYTAIRKDLEWEENPSRGVLIAVQENLAFRELTIDIPDVIAVSVKMKNDYLNIINIYDSPSKRLLDINKLTPLLAKGKTLVVGDFNAHSTLLGSPKTDKYSRNLESMASSFHLTLLNTNKGTYLKKDGTTSSIDLSFISNSLALSANWSVMSNTMGSDHYPIQIDIGTPAPIHDQRIEKYNIKKADWASFYHECIREIEQYSSTDNVEDDYKVLQNVIIKAASKSIPKTRTSKTGIRVPYWNDTCQAAINKRKKAEKKMKRTLNHEDCVEYRKAKAKCQFTIRQEQQQYWANYCAQLTDISKLSQVWRMARSVAGNNGHSIIPTIVQSDNLYDTPEEKATVIGNHLAEISKSSNTSKLFKNRKRRLERKWSNTSYNPPADDDLDSPFSMQELSTALCDSKNGTSPGSDNITYEMVKHLPQRFLEELLTIYNRLWLNHGYITEWNNSIVIPIKKHSTTGTSPEDYRPIALTSSLCKIMERLVTTRLTWWLESRHLLNIAQTGFRKGKGTVDQLVRLQDDALKSIKNKGYVKAVFLDLTKAFDTLWVPGLMHKLRKLQIPYNSYKFISNFLKDRKIRVRIGGILSDTISIINGTPQGSVISPLLFLIMINDFPTTFDPSLKTSLFADDSAIWKTGRNLQQINSKLQEALNDITHWCKKWGFCINAKKSFCITFTRRSLNNDSVLKVNKEPIENKQHGKFLGVVFDSRLTWKHHINYVTTRCQPRVNLLSNIAAHTWGSNKQTLLHLYRTLIRSVIEYGCELFYTASSSQLSKLENIQYKCLKLVCGALHGTPKIVLQNECGELPLSLRIRRQLLRTSVKISAAVQHPAKSVIEPSWWNQTERYNANQKPIYEEIGFLYEYMATSANSVGPAPTPPWRYHDNDPVIDTGQRRTFREIFYEIENHIKERWQVLYSNSKRGIFYKQIYPFVSSKIKYICSGRQKEITLTRLRSGFCLLNYHKYKLNLHPTGACDHCGQKETIEHVLFQCPFLHILPQSISLVSALTEERHLQDIYESLQLLQRLPV